MAIFGIVAVALPVADPKRFGEGVGRFAFFIALGALGVSALAQTGRRVGAWVVGGLLCALVAGLLVVLVTHAPSGGPEQRPRPLPTDELVRADGALRHPSLGFSIPDPGPGLLPQPALARQMEQTVPDSRSWVYADTDAGEIVIVMLTAGTSTSEQTFTEFFEGAARGQMNAMAASGMPTDERERSIRWSERRAHLYVDGGALHQRIDAFGLLGGESLMLVSTASTGERFASLADGVTTP